MLKQRILTALVLALLIVSALLWLPPGGFLLFIAAILLIGFWEWATMLKLSPIQRALYLALSAALLALVQLGGAGLYRPILLLSVLWWLCAFTLVLRYPRAGRWWQPLPLALALGWVVLIPGFVALGELRLREHYMAAIVSCIVLVAAADSFAYFTGRALGRHRLAPNVSPGKTWEGVFGGMTGCVLLGLVGLYFFSETALGAGGWLLGALGFVLLAVFSVVGDLFESMLKRHCQVKDSGKILPGHGGVLDRLDSLSAALPLYVLLLQALDIF
jgi:phosphatidate cytidylyltransferase